MLLLSFISLSSRADYFFSASVTEAEIYEPLNHVRHVWQSPNGYTLRTLTIQPQKKVVGNFIMHKRGNVELNLKSNQNSPADELISFKLPKGSTKRLAKMKYLKVNSNEFGQPFDFIAELHDEDASEGEKTEERSCSENIYESVNCFNPYDPYSNPNTSTHLMCNRRRVGVDYGSRTVTYKIVGKRQIIRIRFIDPNSQRLLALIQVVDKQKVKEDIKSKTKCKT